MDRYRAGSKLQEVAWVDNSSSGHLLKLLAFEVLLKCVHFFDTNAAKLHGSHDYKLIWSKLSHGCRQAVIDAANQRFPGNGWTEKSMQACLEAWQNNFEQGRYEYEVHQDKSDAEIVRLGKAWEALGAPIDQADFAYYPAELNGMIEGLRAFVEGGIGKRYDLDSGEFAAP